MNNIERPKSSYPIPEHAKIVYKGTIFDVYEWDQEMYDGTTQKFEKLKRADTVVVIPVMDDGTILLTEEEQPGRAKYLSSPGGRIDEGEDVLAAAKRELLEETGYEAKEYILWDSIQPVGKVDWAIYTFIAKGLTKVGELNLDAGEKISLKPVNFEEFMQIAKSPTFGEKSTIAKVYEALLDPNKMTDLRALLSP